MEQVTIETKAKQIIGSIILQALCDDEIRINIRDIVIEGSSQWIIGRNVTREVDIIHNINTKFSLFHARKLMHSCY